MTHRPLEFHASAADEIDAAVRWYAGRSRLAAEALLEELSRSVEEIRDAPDRWPQHVHGTRRFLMRRFPYLLIYRVAEPSIQVVAFAHARRRPGYWKERA